MGFDFDFGFECENCGETIGGGLYDFHDSRTLMKFEGWISRKINDDWLNFCCENCLKEYRSKH